MLLLAACVLPPCESLPEAPEVGACLEAPAEDSGGYSDVEADWSGTVAEVGNGAFPEACDRRFGADPVADGWWARLTTADGDVHFGVSTPGSAAPAVGDPLDVKVFDSPGEFGPTLGAVEVRRDSTLIAWVGAAGAPEELRAPDEATMTTGAPVCANQDSCGDSQGYDLDITVSGTAGSAANHATTDIGGADVTVYSLVHQLDAQGACPDWFVASAIVGIAP